MKKFFFILILFFFLNEENVFAYELRNDVKSELEKCEKKWRVDQGILECKKKCLTKTYNLKTGGTLSITASKRSFEKQDELYMIGRCGKDENKPKVTNAKAGDSFHNYMLAFDVVDRSKGYKDTPWEAVGEYGKACGLTWGGDFTSIKDRPHFQYSRLSIKKLKENFGSYADYIESNGGIKDPCKREGVDISGEGSDKKDKDEITKKCDNKRDNNRDYGLIGYNGICDDEKGGASFLALVQKIFNWVIRIAYLLAVIALFYSGFILLTANGQPAKRTQALNIFKNVLIGLFLISAAWLLVDWFFGLFGIDEAYKFTKNN